MQFCARCKQDKPLTDYHPGKRGVNGTYCKPCFNDYKRSKRPAIIRPQYTRPIGPKPVSTTYGAVHLRLRRTRGTATNYTCECGATAEQWAYDHADPYALTGPGGKDGRNVEYSVDFEHYKPMCIECHVRFDAPTRFLPTAA